jgi:uncharacterized protein (TIGR04255 family)
LTIIRDNTKGRFTLPRKYLEAPIIEALAEFHFDPGRPWNATMPGLIYEQLRTQFPTVKQAKGIQARLDRSPEGVRQHVEVADRVQLWSADEKALVQIGANFLAVNRLRPYESWEQFIPMINKGLEEFRGVADPKGLQRVALQYIHRIEIPEAAVNVRDWFAFHFVGPELPEPDASYMTAFIVGVHIPYENERDLLRAV